MRTDTAARTGADLFRALASPHYGFHLSLSHLPKLSGIVARHAREPISWGGSTVASVRSRVSLNPEAELPTGKPGVAERSYTSGAAIHVDSHRGEGFVAPFNLAMKPS
jgi:hypothetical protein